jgi:hypothetical protein
VHLRAEGCVQLLQLVLQLLDAPAVLERLLVVRLAL